MLCPHCQGWVPPATRTCPACGRDLFGPPPEPADQTAPAVSPPAAPAPAANSQSPPPQQASSTYQPPPPPAQPSLHSPPPPSGTSPGGPGLFPGPGGPLPGSGAGVAIGLDPNLAAGLAYLLGFITGIVFLLIEKNDRRVRFAAWQSILYSALWVVYRLVLKILVIVIFDSALTAMGFWWLFEVIITFFAAVISLAFIVGWLVLMIQAFLGKAVRLPYLANLADRWV